MNFRKVKNDQRFGTRSVANSHTEGRFLTKDNALQKKPFNQRRKNSCVQNITQLKTEIDWETQNISFGDFFKSQVNLGKKMSATLDSHDPILGSEPGSSSKHDSMMSSLNKKYPSNSFIRGHLLNDNLGGPGMWHNMFPITSEANKNHLSSVEMPVKRSLLRAHEANKKTKDSKLSETEKGQEWIYVDYSVDAVAENSSNILKNPNAKFHCSWNMYRKKAIFGNGLSDWDDAYGFRTIHSKGNQKTGQNALLKSIDWGSKGKGKASKFQVNKNQILYNSKQIGTISEKDILKNGYYVFKDSIF